MPPFKTSQNLQVAPMIKIKVIPRTTSYPTSTNDEFYLKIDNWNDYSFVTLFDVFYRESKGEIHEIGQIKIGFRGQTIDKPTHSALPSTFEVLDDQFFSVGQDVEFTQKHAPYLEISCTDS